jgi:cytochrome c-type biogenesis protein CcmF
LILAVFVGGALTLFAARARVMEPLGVFGPVSRETALVLNNVLLAVSALVIFVGTMWPFVAEMVFDRIVSVGPPFFDAAFTPFFVALAVILPVGAMLAWKRGSLRAAMQPLIPALILALSLGALAFALQTGRTALGPVGAALGAWVILGALTDLWARTGREGVSARMARLTRLPRADWGKTTAHTGMGITLIGVATLTAWSVEDIRVVRDGERFPVGAYELELRGVERVEGPNYVATLAHVAIFDGGEEVGLVHPEKRFYPVAGMPTTEAGIDNGFTRDVYVVIGDPQDGGGWAIRTYIRPFANWIWGGAILMALGGLISLTDRRLRLAPGAARAPKAVPAE